MSQRVICLLAVLLAMNLLAGCGGQDTPVEQAEEEAGLEEVVEEETTAPYQAPPRDAEEAAADEAKKRAAEAGAKATSSGKAKDQANQKAAEEVDPILELLACQSGEVGASLSPEEGNALGDEMMEAIAAESSPNFQTYLAEQGYTCGGRAEEILAMTTEERMQMPSEEKIELSEERQRMEAEERSKMRQE